MPHSSQRAADRSRLRIRVWDPFVRLFHWGVVLSCAVCWLSAHSLERLHEQVGYAAGALVLLRAAWGLIGTRYARFSNFVRSPRIVIAYLQAIARGHEERFIGHNPAGGAMVVALMLAIGGIAATGWLLTTDAFWGVKWVQHVHNLLAHGLLVLVSMHVAGVVLASLRHQENLIASMVFGTKRRDAGENRPI